MLRFPLKLLPDVTNNKIANYFYIAFSFIAVIILMDFILPGEVVTDRIKFVNKKREQYTNAAKNFHYSYEIITNEDRFTVNEDFATIAKMDDEITYSKSRIFSEVNWYRLVHSDDKSHSTMRILTGMIVPLLVIVVMLIAARIERDISTFAFVVQVLLIADLVYLIL